MDYDRQRVTVVQLSLTRNFYDGGNPSPPLWVQDLEGNIVHENIAPQLLYPEEDIQMKSFSMK